MINMEGVTPPFLLCRPISSDDMAEQKPEEKKGLFQKFKESVDDKEEQLAVLSTMVRLGILIWSGGILTLAYIKLPPALGIPEQKLDPTFIASVFTGTLATFGVQAMIRKVAMHQHGGAPTKPLRLNRHPSRLWLTNNYKNHL